MRISVQIDQIYDWHIGMTALSYDSLLSEFQVIRVLGEGSFGKVFLIRNRETWKQYAMKKYSKYHIFKLGKQKSLIRSARILQALSHPNIIVLKYYIMGSEDEIFLIYEACKKGSLQEVKSSIYSNFDIVLVCEIMYQLARALQYLKSKAVAHRDLKPSNISFNGEAELKVIDFDEAVCYNEELLDREIGFAKELRFDTSNKLKSRRSRANSYVGTEIYMSPEMRYKTVTDERGDLWAYGCILYQLMAGQSLIIDEQQDSEINKKIKQTLSKLRDRYKNQDCLTIQIIHVLDLIERVLKTNPQQRLPIEQILQHQFFSGYSNTNQCRKRLQKYLCNNYNLSHPKAVTQALSNDLIGMTSGAQKFEFLYNLPVFVTEQFPQGRSLFSKLCGLCSSEPPRLCYITGGGRYFKLKNPADQDEKSYIMYSSIDSISISKSKLIIECSSLQLPNSHKRYLIQHISHNQYELGKLSDLMKAIIKD